MGVGASLRDVKLLPQRLLQVYAKAYGNGMALADLRLVRWAHQRSAVAEALANDRAE